MTRHIYIGWAPLLALGVLLAGPGSANAQSTPPAAQKPTAPPATKKKAAPKAKPAAPPAAPDLEPKAIEIIKAASSRLAAAHTVSFTAMETFESLSRQGAPLVYANKFEVTLQRPNKLRVILAGDGPASEFYYDGKLMMAYAPAENLVAIAEAPHASKVKNGGGRCRPAIDSENIPRCQWPCQVL